MKKGGIFKDRYGDLRVGWWVSIGFSLFVGVVGGAIAALIVITTNVDYHNAARGCRHWGEQVGRPAREVRYTWGTWDCLTPNPAVPGTWIPKDNLWVVNK